MKAIITMLEFEPAVLTVIFTARHFSSPGGKRFKSQCGNCIKLVQGNVLGSKAVGVLLTSLNNNVSNDL